MGRRSGAGPRGQQRAAELMPIVLFLRAIFMRSKKRSQAVSEFKKQLDFAVWLILFFIACAVVYSVGKLIYQFWT
jgi:uncharacterized membrane protein YadS